ncbi:MAG TPA: hypothetical protein GXX56_07800 [Rhodocyclaceae bacterium]|nr:hypothetical protein [Rhodocyclaceae bacterium]
MASAKTAMLIFRSEPELKEAVRVASLNHHRSIANMIAVMIRDYCGGYLTAPSRFCLSRYRRLTSADL